MRSVLALCCGIALSAQAETFNAKVIAVMDGDTVLVLREGGSGAAGHPPASSFRGGQKIKVRLANIDAPEKDQAFGQQSRDSLLGLVGKRQVQIDSQALDQYGRIVGLISVDRRNVNQEQVKRGMAWEYSHYHADKTYVGLQNAARQAHLGLWDQTSPQAPWQWRKLHPSPVGAQRSGPSRSFRGTAPVMLYDMDCGKKRRCSQMVSCDEVLFYYTYCGVAVLDGNHDGIPCDNLCKGQK